LRNSPLTKMGKGQNNDSDKYGWWWASYQFQLTIYNHNSIDIYPHKLCEDQNVIRLGEIIYINNKVTVVYS